MSDNNNQNQPHGIRDARIRAGRISADVYLNPTSHGQMFSIDLYASYIDKKGEWHRTNSFKHSDLPFIENAARRAFDHCELNREKAFYRDAPDEEPAPEAAAKTKAEPALNGRER